jgi:fatty acid desaturase
MLSATVEESDRPPRDVVSLDQPSLEQELLALGAAVQADLNVADFRHLRGIEWVGRLCTVLGYGTAWLLPNPLSALLISQGIFTRWLLMHHISHGGYDRVPGVPPRYTSAVFAQGWRRFVDWFDWIVPAAWAHEHNVLHHYHTGEAHDPDLVERHVEFLRRARLPRWLKTLFVLLAGATWKFTYYAPNTLSVLCPRTGQPHRPGTQRWLWVYHLFHLGRPEVRQLWLRSYLPYGLWSFAAVPLLFLPLGWQATLFVLLNRLAAEVLTNLHSFLVIAPNHTGDDLCRFDRHFQGRDEFFRRQVAGSANYHCGPEWRDYLQIYLNYQIEHHLFPRLPMRRYRELQPKVAALCRRHGLPYVQQSVWLRFGQLVRVCTGAASMRRG